MNSLVSTNKRKAVEVIDLLQSSPEIDDEKGKGRRKTVNRTKNSVNALNAQQALAVGKDPTMDIVHQSHLHLHPPANDEDVDFDEEEQTFAQFVDYGKRNPNASGTGRWKLTSKRNKILIISLEPEGSTRSLISTSELKPYIEAFFQLDVDCIVLEKNAIDIEKGRINLKGPLISSQESSHPLRLLDLSPKKKRPKKSKPALAVDVFSLFDALAGLVVEPYICCLALVNHALAEEWDDSVAEVMGRACGDRICCVSLPCHDSKREILATSTHELLHTIGFDHCTSFRCIMNAIASLDNTTLFLSPPNLRKFKAFHKVADNDNGEFLTKHFEDILFVLRNFDTSSTENKQFKHDCIWLESKIYEMRRLFNHVMPIQNK